MGLLILFVLGLSMTSCQKEEILSQDESMLQDYPEQLTIDNWEEFVYAPEEVLKHHARLIEPEKPVSISDSVSSQRQNCTYQGWVKAFSGGWTQMANTVVQGQLHFSQTLYFSETTSLQTPFNWCFSTNPAYTNVKWFYKSPTATYSQQEWVKGVTTIDLVMAQRHILGITPFTSLRQYIAADVDLNGTISSSDLLTMRKLILSLRNDLPVGNVLCNPKNQPFFYIDSEEYNYANAMPGYGFNNASLYYQLNCPLQTPAPPFYTIPEISAYAIKRGDVTGNWTP